MASLNRGWEGVVGVGGDGGVNRAWVGVVGMEEKLSGEGTKERVLIKFRGESRWLMTAYAELTTV